MDVVPVLDLKSGQVVHATGGRREAYAPITTPLAGSSEPAAVLDGLLRLFRFGHVYVADLDAIERRGDHAVLLDDLFRTRPGITPWIDAGIADAGAAQAFLADHTGAVVIGSESQASPDLLAALRADERLLLSLDFRGNDFLGPAELLADPDLWPSRVIVMTLARVGMARGPDVARAAQIVRRATRSRVYAAGGVRDETDLRALAAAGVAGALVATALHNGELSAAWLRQYARPPMAQAG
ncbi:MAG TPA: HisA/HisF-related TIM barrel protein [Acetobacteraceae bacterium]|nr:HisA/HisF-related TIM barrel protein [Acetobacteraceae bacterium]